MNDLFNNILFFVFFALILFAALSDASSFRIPNIVSLGLVALFPVHVLISPSEVDWMGGAAVAAGAFVVGFILFARGWVGGGDVKLLSATLLWAGSTLAAPQLLVMGLVGGVLALGALVRSRTRHHPPDAAAPKVPYGVAIAAGAGYAGMKLLLG
jgi:prepilin peptidase CpaA